MTIVLIDNQQHFTYS